MCVQYYVVRGTTTYADMSLLLFAARVNVTSGEARGGCQLADCEAVPVRVLMTSRGMQGNLAITASSLGLRFHASRPPGRKLLDQLIMKKSVGLLRPGAKQ